jgi:hypothetical protein
MKISADIVERLRHVAKNLDGGVGISGRGRFEAGRVLHWIGTKSHWMTVSFIIIPNK